MSTNGEDQLEYLLGKYHTVKQLSEKEWGELRELVSDAATRLGSMRDFYLHLSHAQLIEVGLAIVAFRLISQGFL